MNKKKEPKKKKLSKVKVPSPKPDVDPENPFDFGGLPERDLKKNLGCG
jgi:hypothetical protein